MKTDCQPVETCESNIQVKYQHDLHHSDRHQKHTKMSNIHKMLQRLIRNHDDVIR